MFLVGRRAWASGRSGRWPWAHSTARPTRRRRGRRLPGRARAAARWVDLGAGVGLSPAQPRASTSATAWTIPTRWPSWWRRRSRARGPPRRPMWATCAPTAGSGSSARRMPPCSSAARHSPSNSGRKVLGASAGGGRRAVGQRQVVGGPGRPPADPPAQAAAVAHLGRRDLHARPPPLPPVGGGPRRDLGRPRSGRDAALPRDQGAGCAAARRGGSLRAAVDLALAESPGIDRLLLVVDQFEELFTLTAEAERKAFVASLLDALDRRPSA